MPAWQFSQVLALVAASVSLHFPTPQGKHVNDPVAPSVAEYLPAAQLSHVDELVAAVDDEYFPALQSVQLPEPMKFAYFPAVQSVQLEDPEVAYVPLEHHEHVDEDVAPAVEDDFPVAHATQVEELVAPVALL